MRYRDIFTESYDIQKARIDQLEDAVFVDSKSIKQSVSAILFAIKNPKNISVKPDGKPAIAWGRDGKGFAMGDKYMLKAGLPHSLKELEYNCRKKIFYFTLFFLSKYIFS